MNKYVSGAIGISMQVQPGVNYLPDILDLKNKRIKHIDLCNNVKYDMDGNSVSANSTGFLNIMEKNTQDFKISSLPLDMLALSINNGNRVFINKIMDMPHSYVEWTGSAAYIYLLFWYDEPEIAGMVPDASADKVCYDAFEVTVNASPNRRYEFGENRTLYGKRFRNLLLEPSYVTPKGNTNAAFKTSGTFETLGLSAFLTLQKGTRAFMRGVPVYVLYQNKLQWPIRMQNIEFDFTNSYIEVSPSASITPVPGTVFLFNCEVDDND